MSHPFDGVLIYFQLSRTCDAISDREMPCGDYDVSAIRGEPNEHTRTTLRITQPAWMKLHRGDIILTIRIHQNWCRLKYPATVVDFACMAKIPRLKWICTNVPLQAVATAKPLSRSNDDHRGNAMPVSLRVVPRYALVECSICSGSSVHKRLQSSDNISWTEAEHWAYAESQLK